MYKKLAAVALAAIYLSGCTTTDPYTGQQKMSNTAGGAMVGAGMGALTGLAVSGGTGKGALIGAAIGGLAGGALGNYMDNQEAELRAQLEGTGISVTRMGDRIILNMPSNITFDTDQDALKPNFFPTLNSVAIVLRKFDRTLIDINGHTDSTGSLAHNNELSQRRAMAVATYLNGQGIDPRRVSAMGFGPSQPIASNASEAGRSQNRRVEITIAPIRA